MPETQTPPSSPVTEDQLHKWLQVTRDLIHRNSLDSAGFQAFMGYEHLAVDMDRMVRKALPKPDSRTAASATVATIELTDSQQAAKRIMGANFFGIEEAVRHFGAQWTPDQLDALAIVPFDAAVLEACRETHVLVAGYPMTLLQIRTRANQAKKGKLFYSPTGGWYESKVFAAKTKVEVRWYLIRKQPVADSTNKTWGEQQALLKDETTPTAAVMTYTNIGHFLNTGERLFENIYVRCSDITSDGTRVLVGGFDAGGLDVGGGWDDDRHSLLGLSASRNF